MVRLILTIAFVAALALAPHMVHAAPAIATAQARAVVLKPVRLIVERDGRASLSGEGRPAALPPPRRTTLPCEAERSARCTALIFDLP